MNIISSEDSGDVYLTPYKSYVGIATQNKVSTTSGLLQVGKSYIITQLQAGDDFSNVGFVTELTPFTATGTTPTTWTHSTEVTNQTDSAPQITILNSGDSNFLGAITWSWQQAGNFFGSLPGQFAENKTYAMISGTGGFSSITWYDGDTINLATFDQAGTQADGWLYLTTIEIRVYR